MIRSLAFSTPKTFDAFDIGIAMLTGSPYCHVELWFDGPINAARCFSSRQPWGCNWAVIDLTDLSNWKIVDLPDYGDDAWLKAEWFCNGSVGQRYDFPGIMGIAMDTDMHDPARRFCSGKVFEIGQKCFGWRIDFPYWHVAPGWTHDKGDRHGLYELATTGMLIVP